MSASACSCSNDNDLNTLLQSEDFRKKIRLAGMTKQIPIIDSMLKRLKLNKSVEQLLCDKIEDLYNELEIGEEEKPVFAKLRALVRRDNIAKRSKIDFTKIKLNSILYDEICQLFQQEIEEKSCAQCIEWFCTIENEGWDGKNLFKKNKTDVIKKMNLTDGQKGNYEELLEKLGIAENKAEGGKSETLIVKDTVAAVISQAGSVQSGDTIINGRRQ